MYILLICLGIFLSIKNFKTNGFDPLAGVATFATVTIALALQAIIMYQNNSDFGLMLPFFTFLFLFVTVIFLIVTVSVKVKLKFSKLYLKDVTVGLLFVGLFLLFGLITFDESNYLTFKNLFLPIGYLVTGIILIIYLRKKYLL